MGCEYLQLGRSLKSGMDSAEVSRKTPTPGSSP